MPAGPTGIRCPSPGSKGSALTLDTATLPDAAPMTAPSGLTSTWQLELDRCALEVNYTVLGLTVWRARLRPVDMHIVRSVAEPGLIRLSGTVAARPAYASLPATRGLFLPRAGRRALIRFDGDAALSAGAARPVFQVGVGARQWSAAIHVRFTPHGADRAVVAACGVLNAGGDAPAPAGELGVELAAEFVRCA
jgi:hypothetical protein